MLTRSQARAASSSRAKQPTLKGPPSLSSVTSIPPFQGSVFLPSNLLPPRNRDAYHSSPPHHETGMAADRSERAARGQVVRQANDLADRLLTKLDAAMQDKQSAEELVVSLLQEKTLMKSSLQETEREKGNLQEQLVFIESQQDLFNQSFNRISDENYQ